MNTHDITPDEARRLLDEDKQKRRYADDLSRAREWYKTDGSQFWKYVDADTDGIYTPYGFFTIRELRGDT